MNCKKINLLTILCFSFCGLQANQAAVAPLSLNIDNTLKKKVVIKDKAKKTINFNCELKINNKLMSSNLWNTNSEINLNFFKTVSTHLRQHDLSYNFNKHLPKANNNLSGEKIFEKISLGYLEETFSLKNIKETVDRAQPSFSTKGVDSSLNFKIDTFQTQAKATYKSNFEAKLILDFNIQDSEFVLSKNLTKNTAISLNLQNSDLDQRQTVNLALAW